MGISVWQILIIGVILVLLFGRGKISELMGDVAKGINSFKKGLAEDDESARKEANRTIEHTPASTVNTKDAERSRNV
ncbi:twin-arginine translocase TatA/TatE family subunit [Acuticoccus kandeliae]|uniref:twin-arginine translocase TatA/TatE family subunit n=1 Tax=Acuticoccus kandeliae TaxID=2073160 RepID=UPI000D3E5652|nr:twin-arginine translocase TatA/TatE family subunit [Acuticoccus kandeliae]